MAKQTKKRFSVSWKSFSFALIGFMLVFYFLYTPGASKLARLTTTHAPTMTCPVTVTPALPKTLMPEDFVDSLTMSNPPVFLNEKEISSVAKIDEPLEPYTAPKGESFFPPGQYPWTTTYMDVDNDGQNEAIMTADLAMNHTPHLLYIVKNNRVIFKIQGINVAAQEADSRIGFIYNETLDWLSGTSKRTRYVYDNGAFIPVWQQTYCQVQEE